MRTGLCVRAGVGGGGGGGGGVTIKSAPEDGVFEVTCAPSRDQHSARGYGLWGAAGSVAEHLALVHAGAKRLAGVWC